MLKTVFAIETIEIIILMYIIIKKGLLQSSGILFYWFIVNSFYSPAIYYVCMNGRAYRVFGEDALLIYLIIGAVYIAFVIFFSILLRRKYIIIGHLCKIRIQISKQLVSAIVIIICLVYIAKYNYGFPVLNYFRTGAMVDYRPDTSGEIPHFLIMGTFIMMVLPMIYFYFDELRNWNNCKLAVATVCLLPFLFISGNKGVLIYFVIFFWIYKLNYNINFGIIGMGLFSLYAYSVIKGTTGIVLIESAIRRFFVTQGAGLPARIQMILNGYDFTGKWISDEVFQFIYHNNNGSHPTFFMGDFMAQMGIIVGMILSIIVTGMIILVSYTLDRYELPNYAKWPYYIFLYIVGGSGIHRQLFYRMTIVLTVYFFLKSQKCIFCNIKRKEANEIYDPSVPSSKCVKKIGL